MFKALNNAAPSVEEIVVANGFTLPASIAGVAIYTDLRAKEVKSAPEVNELSLNSNTRTE